MMYNYTIKYSDGTSVTNQISVSEKVALIAVMQEIQEHMESGEPNPNRCILSIKVSKVG